VVDINWGGGVVNINAWSVRGVSVRGVVGVRSGSNVRRGHVAVNGSWGGLNNMLISGSVVLDYWGGGVMEINNWGSGVVDIDDGSGGVMEVNDWGGGVMNINTWGVRGVSVRGVVGVRLGISVVASGIAVCGGWDIGAGVVVRRSDIDVVRRSDIDVVRFNGAGRFSDFSGVVGDGGVVVVGVVNVVGGGSVGNWGMGVGACAMVINGLEGSSTSVKSSLDSSI
jgi:hypothetical protein